MSKLSLAEFNCGCHVVITELGNLAMKKRFIEFGFVVGNIFCVYKHFKHSIILERGNCLIAIDSLSASNIFAKEVIV